MTPRSKIFWSQAIRVEKKDIQIGICEDGKVVVLGASEVEVIVPYQKDNSQNIRLGDNKNHKKLCVDDDDDLYKDCDELCVSVSVMPHSCWDLDVVLFDRGNLLKRNRPCALVVAIDGDDKSKEPIVYAQDGIGDWTKQEII